MPLQLGCSFGFVDANVGKKKQKGRRFAEKVRRANVYTNKKRKTMGHRIGGFG